MKESKKIGKYLNTTIEQKKQWSMRVTVIPIIVGTLGRVPIAEISLNTQNSLRLAVTQTKVKHHQQMPAGKTL